MTPEKIDKLEDNEIFVFGSNALGRHWWWAARTALDKFWAVRWQAQWLQWQSYWFITLDEDYKKLPFEEIVIQIYRLLVCANQNKNLTFFVTKVGCWIAWYTESEIEKIFKIFNFPENIILPWK